MTPQAKGWRERRLEEAIMHFDVERFALGHGGSVDKADGTEIRLDCPRCCKRKLNVNTRKATWRCFYCEREGRRMAGGIVELVALLERLSKRSAADYVLAEAAGMRIPDILPGLQQAPQSHQGDRLWALPIDWPPQTVRITPESMQRLPYLKRRGIDYNAVRAYGIMHCTGGRFGQRLLFPVFEKRELVYFQARAMWEASEHTATLPYIKALNPSKALTGTVSQDVLMNLDQARQYPRVVLVEGPIDCVHAGPSAVCTFGKAISPRQVAKLRASGVRAVDLMWDGPSVKEPAGAIPQMAAIAPYLASFFEVRVVHLPQGDPGDYPTEVLDAWREAAPLYHAKNASSAPPLGTTLRRMG